MAKKLNQQSIVYSTNPDFQINEEQEEITTLAPQDQLLYLALERHGGGKIATVISNYIGKIDDITALAKLLKNKCGVGGSVKDGVILIQGDNRDKCIAYLSATGYKVKKKGG
jgi:translation initiation factor 1